MIFPRPATICIAALWIPFLAGVALGPLIGLATLALWGGFTVLMAHADWNRRGEDTHDDPVVFVFCCCLAVALFFTCIYALAGEG